MKDLNLNIIQKVSDIMRKRKIPMRKCIATSEQYPKNEMFRIVRTPDGDVIVDLSGKANGRGAYISKTENAILLAKSKKLLNRHLQTDVPDTIYLQLTSLIKGDNDK